MGGLRTHLHHSIMIPMQAGGIKETGGWPSEPDGPRMRSDHAHPWPRSLGARNT